MKTLIASLSVILTLAAVPAMAVDNPFTMSGAASMQVADNHGDKKKEEAKCEGDSMKKEGKCGEGKCGDSMKKEGKCGDSSKKEGGKCGEGKK